MRLLCLWLAIGYLTEVGCQNENFPNIFDVIPRKRNVVGAAEIVEPPEEVNEGSDSFVTSTEVLVPRTESTVPTMKHEVQTVEPLELTTAADRNATVQVPNVPAVNVDDTHPLPDEVLVADPFSIDESGTTERTVDVPAVAPVVPVIHAYNKSLSSTAEPEDGLSSSPTESEEMETTATSFNVPIFPSTLERRVLKEQEEAMSRVGDPTSDVRFEAETTEILPSSTEFLSRETSVEPSQVTDGAQKTATERSEFEDFTSNSKESLSDSTTLSESTASEFFPIVTVTTAELPVNEESSFTGTNPATIISTTTRQTTSFDEDAPPFDQEKLSRLFEQDGSFIPDHLVNQPSPEPMFPRVELPEESTEILNDKQQRKTSTTTELSPSSVSVSDNDQSTATTNSEMSSTRHTLQQIVIQPFSSRTANSEMSQTVGTLSLDSKNASVQVAVLKSGADSSSNQEETSTTSSAPVSISANTNTELSQESLKPAPEATLTITGVNSEIAPEPVTETVAESAPNPEEQPQPQPEPKPAHELMPEPKVESQPEIKLEPHFVSEPAASKPEPEPQPEPEPKPEPQAVPEPADSKPASGPQPQPEPRLEPQAIPEPSAPKPEPEPQPQPEPSLEPHAVPEPTTSRPEPAAEPGPESQPEPEPEPETRLEPQAIPEPAAPKQARPWQPMPDSVPESEQSSTDLIKTMLTMRITSVEYTEEFEDKSSGKYKKLSEQIIPQISAILKSILGECFAGFEIISFTEGSVIVNGVILTRDDIHDAEELATKIETSISSNGSLIGLNEVDLRSIAVNGIPSRAYVERMHSPSPYPQNGTTSSALLIGSMIAVGVLIILVVAFVAIAINSRRTNGTMKLKDDDMPRLENGKAAYSNPQPVSVNLTSYGNGTTTTPSNGQSMVTVSPPSPATAPTSHF